MSLSRKYGRTYHYPFSPGTSSDDRINAEYWNDISQINAVVHTEKLDGENTCLNQYGVFARSHAAPTRHPWAAYLKEKWHWLRRDLGDLEIFGENLYAIHSIKYEELVDHFFVFAIRVLDYWLCWEEVKFYAALMEFPTVPEIEVLRPNERSSFEACILKITKERSAFASVDVHTNEACWMEGIVTRNIAEFSVDSTRHNLFKYVRKDHVKTDEHWTKNWQRAALKWETSCGK